MPETMRVFKADGKGGASVLSDVPRPSLRPDYVLIRAIAVALNPTDWKHIGFVTKPVTIGCDFSGIVEEVGKEVKKLWNKGDRVCGFVHGGNVVQGEDGAFGEFLVAKGDLLMSISDDMMFEEAATFPVGAMTCGQGMYQSMQLPWPTQPAKETSPILIYGGSTATGALAIQFAKLSNLEVITTCSPHNFDFIKSLGADHVLDYSSTTCGPDIRKLTNNKLFNVFDCIGEGSSPTIAGEALSDNGDGKLNYSSILSGKVPRDDVESKSTLGYTVVGEAFEIRGKQIPAKPKDFEFAEKWVKVAEKLLKEKKIKPHRHEVKEGGLDGITLGLKDMKDGKVSGVKWVYRISGEQGFMAVQ